MKSKYLEVLTYNRKENTAYVAESYSFIEHLDEVTLEDQWYNWSYPLDIIEKVLGIEIMTPDKLFITFTISADQLHRLMDERKVGFIE